MFFLLLFLLLALYFFYLSLFTNFYSSFNLFKYQPLFMFTCMHASHFLTFVFHLPIYINSPKCLWRHVELLNFWQVLSNFYLKYKILACFNNAKKEGRKVQTLPAKRSLGTFHGKLTAVGRADLTYASPLKFLLSQHIFCHEPDTL